MAKPMILYGRILSPYLARCAIAANAKGLKLDIKLPAEGIKSPSFLKLNPLGQIPVLVDGPAAEGRKSKKSRASSRATAIYESAVIVGYLDTKSKKTPLFPKAPKALLASRLPAAVAADYVQPNAAALFRLKRGIAAPHVTLEGSAAALDKGLDALEHVLAKGRFAGGSAFTSADCIIPPALQFATRVAGMFALPDPLKGRPKLAKYWASIQKHKAVKPVIDAMHAMMDDALAGKLPPLR
ncbi:MAG: glutathione S-transferase family protein [Rhodospirillaceae bacterium]|nr:glutathione S-transferase family protein [Rhodospirillaceae bacterium]